MAIDFTFATDVLNPDGKVRLITSLELFVRTPDDKGEYKQYTPVGLAQSMDVNEDRNIVYNFVIGNKNPARCRDLIPGPVTSSTIALNMVTLYQVNGVGLLSVHNPTTKAINPGLPYNKRPFELVERWFNPTSGKTLYEIIYTGCYIRNYSSPKTMDGNDIRVFENMNVDFKDLYFVASDDFDSEIASGTLGQPFKPIN